MEVKWFYDDVKLSLKSYIILSEDIFAVPSKGSTINIFEKVFHQIKWKE